MLSDKAEKVFNMKYSLDGEKWEQTCWRVSSYIADDDEQAKKFFELIYNKIFIPGGRILANAGTEIKNLNNCFVLPVEDSRKSIYSSLGDAAEIFAWGGGVGYNFSSIREEGSNIKTTGGKASGPLSFMSLFDQTGEVIQQASRRGAQIGLLDIDHPDIEKFINYKSTPNSRNKRLLDEYKRNLTDNGLDKRGIKYFKVLEKTLQDDQLSHFNISVVLTNDFMNAVKNDEDWNLISRQNNDIVKTIKARNLLEQVSKMAWESGDPGVFFYDRTNEDNMVPYLGEIKATNPCGEIGLLSYEPCCLGSLNLHAFYDGKGGIDFEFLEYATRIAIDFLDNVQEKSFTPLDEVNKWSKGLRRLGLGVMGWADLLAELEIPYDNEKAFDLAELLGWFITFFSWLESFSLSEDKGPFPFYDEDRVDFSLIEKIFNSKFSSEKWDMEYFKKIGPRNVSVTSVAPTGTIAIISDVNSGIEPFFALYYKRNITQGIGNTAVDSLFEFNPIFLSKLKDYSDKDINTIKNYLELFGTLVGCNLVSDELKEVFKTSMEISWKDHIKMQAAWQKYISNSISKTINLSEDSTEEDIYNAIIYMWENELKGGTVYRNNSKTFQILNTAKKDICPNCGNTLQRESGCVSCKECGYSLCEIG